MSANDSYMKDKSRRCNDRLCSFFLKLTAIFWLIDVLDNIQVVVWEGGVHGDILCVTDYKFAIGTYCDCDIQAER